MANLIGIDLGGTTCGGAVVSREGCVLARVSRPVADRAPGAVAELIIAVVADAIGAAAVTKADIAAVGVCSPGRIIDGCVVGASNFPLMRDFPLASIVERAVGRPTRLVNDADAAMAAEFWVGAASSVESCVMLTLGTGVGMGAVCGGNLLAGSTGLIEGGHMIIVPGGRPCGCGQRGCLETYASATAVKREGNAALADALARGIATELEALAAAHGGEVDAKDVVDAARNGDAVAVAIVDDAAKHLAIGCITVARVLDPQMIIFAGGLALAGEFLFEQVRRHIARLTWTAAGLPREIALGQASVKNDAGVIGAAAAARPLLSAL
jgi:glucokinase